MRKTILALASVLIMLVSGAVFLEVSDDSDVSAMPAPEKVGVEGKPITVFKADGSMIGLDTISGSEISDGDEIWFYSDITLDESITVNGGKKITVKLHYCTLSFTPTVGFRINQGDLDLGGTGVVNATRPIQIANGLDQEEYVKLNVGPGIELNGTYSLMVYCPGVEITFAGKINATIFGIYINGNIENVDNRPKLTILPGSIINGSSDGIYCAGNSEWTIDGATITGDVGIEIRAGKMTITDSLITGTGIPTTVESNGNGTTTTGAGMAIVQHTTRLAIDVVLDSTTVTGYTALFERNIENSTSEQLSLISINVLGGSFESTMGGTLSVYSQDFVGFINGGTFSSDVSAYVAEGKVMSAINGKYVVATPATEDPSGVIESTEDTVIANVGTSSYADISLPSASMEISGIGAIGNIMVSAEKTSFTEAPQAIASYEITIVCSTSYSADITVDADIPLGHVALVYYIDDNGELIPVEVVDYTSSTVTFRTNHTTPFVIMSEEDYVYEDDLYYPGQGTITNPQDEGSDDSTKLVAIAAAVVVIMLAVVALMVTRNN